MVKKKILIINYAFPPNPGVGGRRWAKFTKYLNRKGVELEVIASKPYSNSSKWTNDIKDVQDKVHYFNFGYPRSLQEIPKSNWDKIMYRLSLPYVKLRAKGNYYDRASLRVNRFNRFVKRRLDKGDVMGIIVTVAPFHLAVSIADLKKNFPKVKFIVDYRDPWTNNRTSYGFQSLSRKRQLQEECFEHKVLTTYDKILCVAPQMRKGFKDLVPEIADDKLVVLPNGFDPEDVIVADNYDNQERKEVGVRMIFAGTFYGTAYKYLDLLDSQLNFLKVYDTELYNLVRVDFYGGCDLEKTSIFRNHHNVIFNGMVPLNVVQSELSKSQVGLIFLTDDINYSISTKFCEYVGNKVPIALYSNGGKSSEYVIKNNIGIAFNESSNDEEFVSFIKNIDQYKSSIMQFDSSDLNIDFITNRLIELLND